MNRRNNDEVHGSNALRVIFKKSLPSLPAAVRLTLHHMFGDGGLRNRLTQQQDFAVDSERTPKWIFLADPPDQIAQLRVDLWAPAPVP